MKTWFQRSRADAVERRLKEARPTEAAPESLHDDIMRRVRLAARSRVAAEQRAPIRWPSLPAPGLAVLVVLFGLWIGFREPVGPSSPPSREDPPSLAIAAAPLNFGRLLAAAAPNAALAPLENEFSRIRSDARRAMDLVLASLPQDARALVEQGGPRPGL